MKKIILQLSAVLFLFSCGSKKFDINKEGGTIFTLEPDVVDFLVKTSGHSQEPVFLIALDETRKNVRERNMGFIAAFIDHYKTLGGNKPAHIFMMGDREKFTLKMSDEEVKKKLMEEYDNTTRRIEHILEHRLENFGIPESERNVYKDKSGRIVIELGGSHDPQKLHRLMQATADFGFYETYNNKDAYTYIDKVNAELSHEMYPGIDSMAHDDSEYQKMKYPLFRYLQPDIRQTGKPGEYTFSTGCRIGFAKFSDTAAVNHLLKMETTRLIVPRDMLFAWSLRPEEMGNNNDVKDVAGLYVIKAKNIFEPVLSGRVITDAHAGEEANSGRVNVSMTMNGEGADEWEKITRENREKAIAMVLDGHVVSAPIVQGPIPNGQSTISGNFTKEEAEEMAIILRSGSLPIRTHIIDEKKVSPKK